MSRRRKERPGRGRRGRAGAPAPPPIPTPSPALGAACALGVFAAAFLVHLPTLGHGFVSWDDPVFVTGNPWIREISFAHVWRLFSEPYASNHLPLYLLSFMADYAIWGLAPFGYHLHSVLLAALNAALAWWLTQRLFGSPALATVAALLFAVHPAHVEAVAWVSSRKDLLATFFLLVSLLCYQRARRGPSLAAGAYAASLACFALGLLSKVSIAAAPLFLIALERLRPSGEMPLPWRAALARAAPFAAVALALVALNALAQPRSATMGDPLAYALLKGRAVWSYLALLTGIPRGRPVYDEPVIEPDLASLAVGLSGVLLLPALVWLGVRRRSPELGWGAGWVLALLLPALAFPLLTYMSDRYLYTPSLGACWVLAAGILALGRAAGTGRRRTAWTALLTALPLALFAARTLEYGAVWADSQTLWTRAMQHSRDLRIQLNLAGLALDERRFAEAERLYREATAVENHPAHQGLALVYLHTGRPAEAEREIDRALEIAARSGAEPGVLADLHYARGLILWAQEQPEPALAAWRAALRADPQHPAASEALRQVREAGSATKPPSG